MHAVVEFVINIQERGVAVASNSEEEKKGDESIPSLNKKASVLNSQSQKNLGIGFVVVPLFGQGNSNLPAGAKIMELLQGSPRLIISGKPLANMKKTSSSLQYEVLYGNQNENLKSLMFLIPSEIIVGPNDKIPGLKLTMLPGRFVNFDEQMQFSERKTIFAHNIRVTSLDQIEAGFTQYLRKMCVDQSYRNNRQVTAEVIERKLTFVPHNTWRQIG